MVPPTFGYQFQPDIWLNGPAFPWAVIFGGMENGKIYPGFMVSGMIWTGYGHELIE
jgi:hypothetical protein